MNRTYSMEKNFWLFKTSILHPAIEVQVQIWTFVLVLFLVRQGNNCRSPIKVQDQLYRKVVDNYSEIIEELYAHGVKFSSKNSKQSEGHYIVLVLSPA